MSGSTSQLLDSIFAEPIEGDPWLHLSKQLAKLPGGKESFSEHFFGPVAERPSEWAPRNIRLESGPRPGPWRNDFMPFTRAILDLEWDAGTKKGAVIPKPSQVGLSETILVQMVCALATQPGPALYVVQEGGITTSFSRERFRPLAMQVPTLAKQLKDRKRRNLIAHYDLEAGPVDFVSAGTEKGLISVARRRVYLDEFEASSREFPASSGSLYEIATARMELYPHNSWITAFGHPAEFEDDIHELLLEHSDQGRWVFDCPHCGSPVDTTDPDQCIDYKDGTGPGGERTPDDAVLICQSCGCEVSDSDRQRELWEESAGGSGRFWSPLPEQQALQADLLGCWVTTLCNHRTRVRDVAHGLLTSKTPPARKAYLNKKYGAPFKSGDSLITPGLVRDLVVYVDEMEVPAGPMGVKFIVGGVDVQAPKDNPTLFFVAVGYDVRGNAFIVDRTVLQGWTAYHEYRSSWSIKTRDESGKIGSMGLYSIGLDAAYETTQVLDNTRHTAHSATMNRRIQQLAVQFQPSCDADMPIRDVPKEKCIDRLRPHLGPVPRKYLHRHSWIDRIIRRIHDKRYVVPVVKGTGLPPDFEAHLSSNALMPQKPKWKGDEPKMEWEKAKQSRDDFLTALAYAEATAAILHKLDRIHELASPRTKTTTKLPSIGW